MFVKSSLNADFLLKRVVGSKLMFLQNHTATYGFAPHLRHAVRVACHGERPVLDPSGNSQEGEIRRKLGLSPMDKNGARISNYND